VRKKEITDRENYLRALEYRNPAWIPITFEIVPAMYRQRGKEIAELISRHPSLFGGGIRQFDSSDPLFTYGNVFRDDWGCVWRNAQDGVIGQVVGHPLADWSALKDLVPPDPLKQVDWLELKAAAETERKAGRPVVGTPESFSHGGFFDRLQFLRGLENLFIDMMEGAPQLDLLIEMVLDYNMKYIRKYLELEPDILWLHGDIGTQNGLMLSMELFRRYLKPSYKKMFQACRSAGCHVWYSSDGNIMEAVPDLVECGVSVHDPQVRANTIEGIRNVYKGKLCALVDLDEQMLPLCSPGEIRDQMRQIVEELGDPRGGLMIFAAPSVDVPPANLEAICSAWEEYCFEAY
jgi:uroporphyrinogen decarboxylase